MGSPCGQVPVTLYVMCGLAFAGKTTLAAAISQVTGASIVSLDGLNRERGLEGGLGLPDEEWVRTHEIARERVEAGLRCGVSTVVDDTNCFRFLRDDYRAVAARCGARTIVVHVDIGLPVALRRLRENRMRPVRAEVTEQVLLNLARRFEPPGADETTLTYRGGTAPKAWVESHILAGLD